MSDLLVPGKFRRGNLRNESEAIKQRESAICLLNMMCRQFGLKDMANIELLDIGCGSKFTEAFLEEDLPIGRYIGVDVYKQMIDFLRQNVDDPRFEYHHLNAHNEMYNTNGEPMTGATALPLGDRQFDLISLFSVFTHLAPHDFSVMLKLLRPYIKSEGRLIFTVFINEPTAGGYGLVDSIRKTLADKGEEYQWDENSVPDFVDAGHSPLQWALYSRKHALELIENTGWEIESLNQPEAYWQHYFILKPA